MNGTRHQFFSGPRVSKDENRRIALAYLSDQIIKATHRSGFANQPAKGGLAFSDTFSKHSLPPAGAKDKRMDVYVRWRTFVNDC
jgi:hypothetical protein